MVQQVVHQNADTNSACKIQSVPLQTVPPQKLNYSQGIGKMYQPYQSNSGMV